MAWCSVNAAQTRCSKLLLLPPSGLQKSMLHTCQAAPQTLTKPRWACRGIVPEAAGAGRQPPAAVLQHWRRHAQPLHDVGVTGLTWRQGFDLIWPLQRLTGVLICTPFVLTRGVVPLVGLSPEVTQQAFTLGFAAELLLLAGWYGASAGIGLVKAMHASIRDERYLVGKLPKNLTEGRPPQQAQ